MAKDDSVEETNIELPQEEEENSEGNIYNPNNVIDADVDNPPAGTPGHPGIDEGTG